MNQEHKREIVVILPDLHSGHNVGSFFRTADGAGIRKIFLVGFTPTPEQPQVQKVSLGAEESVAWEQRAELVPLLQELQQDGWQIVAIEQNEKSVPYTEAAYAEKIALVFGNERHGVPEDALALSDLTIEIPMRGVKESLNVSIAGGIVMYEVTKE